MQQTLRSGTTGEIVTTGQLIATGGEGGVFALLGDHTRVAKIYNSDKRTTHQERKLQVMLAHPPPDATRVLSPPHISLAWPTELLYDRRGRFVGFLMPRISPKFPQILQLYNPAVRRQKYPDIHWKYLHRLALNLSGAFAGLHSRGYVIGDVNSANIHVDPRRALVTVVDTDSFQVTDPRTGRVYRCPVGTLEYTPPEMRLVRSYASVDRTPQCDLFGLGVLLFKLLMEGYHPFMGAPKYPTIEVANDVTLECIKRGIFPYAPSASFAPPVNAPPFSALDPAVQDLFRQCFVGGSKDPLIRPTAHMWIGVLQRAEASLLPCAKDPRHWYSPQFGSCHWCLRQKPRPYAAMSALTPPPRPVAPTFAARRGLHLLLTGWKSRFSWYNSLVIAALLVVILTISVLTLMNPPTKTEKPPDPPSSQEKKKPSAQPAPSAATSSSQALQPEERQAKPDSLPVPHSFTLTSLQPVMAVTTGAAIEVSGQVTLTDTSEGIEIVLQAQNLPGGIGTQYPSRIRRGSCHPTLPDPPEYIALEPVIIGEAGQGLSKTVLAGQSVLSLTAVPDPTQPTLKSISVELGQADGYTSARISCAELIR